jgi:uncharacterized protein YdeI (YjbR/CyaY-like superfamily)
MADSAPANLPEGVHLEREAVGQPVAEELVVADAASWRGWLEEHHGTATGAWLVLAKKGTVEPTTLTYDQALEEALTQGWIDATKRARDGSTYLQRFTPRRPRSIWSKRNVGLVARLTREDRMCAAGLVEVARAKSDGRWVAAYAGPASIEVPAELTRALAGAPAAAALFELLTSQNRYAILHRVVTAKRDDTRLRRIEHYVGMLARGETPYPQQRRGGLGK